MAKEDEAIAASLALLHTVDLADDAVNCVCWSKDGTQVSHALSNPCLGLYLSLSSPYLLVQRRHPGEPRHSWRSREAHETSRNHSLPPSANARSP